MIRTFLWFLLLAIIMIISIPFWILAKLTPGKAKMIWPQMLFDALIPIVKGLAGFKVETSGKENILDGPALYVGNHQGLFDMVIALEQFGKLKPFLAKIEASKIPLIGSWMKIMDCVFIDRSNLRSSLESIKKCEEVLKSGKSIIIFPEGTRSRKHEMGEFKSGALRCAIKAGVPIVPFVIDGTYHAWEEQKKIVPTKASLKILPPIQTEGMEKERTKHISEEIELEIKKALG